MQKHIFIVTISVACLILAELCQCTNGTGRGKNIAPGKEVPISSIVKIDTTLIPHDKFGDAVRYGRELMINTSYYIGPEGVSGKYLGNKMNCTNCHQEAGTKPYSFNLMASHDNYPQYRPREGRVLTLAERINNCVMRPHNGKPLPLDSREMIAFLSYLKWINGFVAKGKIFDGQKNLPVIFPDIAASPERGKTVYVRECQRCHGTDGQGLMRPDGVCYTYPPLWGQYGYQPGSSMHRIIKQAQWLKANMPHDKATWQKPVLTDADALDVAAFVNDDGVHQRPTPKSFDYPIPSEKAIDYDKGPYADSFTEAQHKYGPFNPIIKYWNSKGVQPVY